MVQIENRNSN